MNLPDFLMGFCVGLMVYATVKGDMKSRAKDNPSFASKPTKESP